MKAPLAVCIVTAGVVGAFALPAQAHGPGRSTPFHRCVNAALAAKPGKVVEVELESKEGRQVYDIDILGKDGKRWELKCDLATTKIVKIEEEDDDDKDKARSYSSKGQQAAQPAFQVSEEQAKQTALRQYQGELTKVVHEYDSGRPRYEVHIRSPQGTRIEVEIDGTTGEVLEVSEKPR